VRVAWFEVFIPSLEAGAPGITLTLEAPNWIGALRTGLQNIGEGQASISNVMCDIKEDNSIHVTDVASHRVFRLREVPKPGAPPSPTSAPAAVPSAATPKAPGGEGGFSSGPKTLLEFQRPDFSKLPPSMPPPPRQTTDVDDDPDTIQMEAATNPEAPRFSMGQSTIEMSIPWATMPAPSSAPTPGVTLPSPTTARPTPAPLQAPTRTSATPPVDKGYDLTLRQPKAPGATTTPAAAVPRDVSMPPEAPAAVTSPSSPSFPPLPPKAPQVEAVKTEPALPTSPPAPVAKPVETPAGKAVEQTEKITTRSPSLTSPPADVTERLPRAPEPKKKTGPVPSPTPRGTTAPPPKRKTGQFEDAPQPVRREMSRENPVLKPAGQVSAEAIADAVADVFDATQDLLMEGVVEPRRVAEALLDIALAHVPAESGSFYLADLNGHVLSFAAVRGPKADAIMRGRFTVPVGQGIIGFCALEGICLRVADMQKDPHYAAQIADAVGYVVKDTLCASAEKDGRLYGAIQLINARQGFTAAHMEVLRYIGLTAAQLLERHFESA
jgi:hypothetical protein